MKLLIVFCLALIFVSCGNNSDTKDKTSGSSSNSQIEAKDPEVAKGLALITNSDCFTCHKLTETSIGPPYSAVAEKYKTLNDASMDSIVTQIIRGGSGKWGAVPMTPHPQISKQDAQTMAHYIMSIKK
jgi:cytochrome c